MKPSYTHQKFKDQFGKEPEVVIRAPGRINLIGDHIDYLEGRVLPMAINKHIEMAATPNSSGEIKVWSEAAEGPPVIIPLNDLFRDNTEAKLANYISGVVVLMKQKGIETHGFDAVITSTLPQGAGMSSSAALTTATALCMEALAKKKLEPFERALLCQHVEHEFAGVPCGIMDQLAVGMSQQDQALLIDCQSLRVENVTFPDDLDIVVCDSGIQHSLADGEYKRRREECREAMQILKTKSLRYVKIEQLEAEKKQLGETLYHRARHAITEMERVLEFVIALQYSDITKVARLMWDSHFSLKDDFDVSCMELDHLVRIAYDFGRNRGLLGSRMTGGGFGGSTVNLVRSDASHQFITYMKDKYKETTGQDISPFITRPSPGAHDCTPLSARP